jgi:hypothetical protein
LTIQAKTREEARALGLDRYTTGKPCKHGHLSDRNTRDGKCYECCRVYDRGRTPIRSKTAGWIAVQIKARMKLKREVVEHYGGKCACCGITRIEFLCFDHINNDGSAHRRVIGRYPMARWLKSHGFPDGFQVLCWNCNSAKQILGECRCQSSEAA